MNTPSTPKLRFAALVRVSTEKQEKSGESLRTQRSEIQSVVSQRGDEIVGWYGGQEHATPGHEKKEIDRLLTDARDGVFDAVIVANADRWSRDNSKSREGLDVLKQHRVKFFIGTSEQDLFNPEHRLFLGMSAEFGQFQAAHQVRKSIINRINRAGKGWPTCGRMPFGRTFNRETGTWGIDPEKQAVIQKVAERYLAGESLAEIAAELGRNHAYLHTVLTQRCGTQWVQEFRSDNLNIHEVVKTTIPPLLSDETIEAILARAAANKTYSHGQQKYPYLLGRMVFCGHCGYAMSGQYVARNGLRYYRHTYGKRERECCVPRGWVRADELEEAVIRYLFEMFGNPVAVQRAVEAAIPNHNKLDEARDRLVEIDKAVDEITSSRRRISNLVSKNLLPADDAEPALRSLSDRMDRLQAEAKALRASLANSPSPEAVAAKAETLAASFGKYAGMRYASAKLDRDRELANEKLDRMTWDERRALVQMVFGGNTPDGKPMGVYVERSADPRPRRGVTWKFRIVGHLIEDLGPHLLDHHHPDDFTNNCYLQEMQRHLCEVTKSASCFRRRRRSPAWRSWRPGFRRVGRGFASPTSVSYAEDVGLAKPRPTLQD